MPEVHNKYHRTDGPNAVYIGRGSPFGNPFLIGKHGGRDEVCDRHAAERPSTYGAGKGRIEGKGSCLLLRPQTLPRGHVAAYCQ